MVSTLNLDEKYNRVRKNFCFYLDIQDHGLARSISRRIQDMGLQQEVFLTSRVSHVIRERWCEGGPGSPRPPPCPRRDARRASAMVESARRHRTPPPAHLNHHYVTLTVHKALSLLDKLYDTFFTASRKSHVRLFTKHFIKIEFLDKACRPVFKEFDEWPTINVEPDPPKLKKKTESPEHPTNNNLTRKNTAGQKMTRKSRPRIKEKEDKETKGGFCEMCNAEYADSALHRRSPHHLAFVRDHNNFLALDSLIGAGADVATFLDKAAPVNGERRSQRRTNGDVTEPARRPRRDDKSYYKVVGVSTKLRSSGGFAKKKEPLVVKFRQVRRSELSVLSDEAEQFMFPKRVSSTGSTASSEDESEASAPPAPERRRARPARLKEESSEDDAWPEDARRRKRRCTAAPRRARRAPPARPDPPPPEEPPPAPTPAPEPAPTAAPPPAPAPAPAASTTPPDDKERCMKWEDGRLKYTPAVEQLEFAFESVPRSEPWFESFRRQDQDKVLTRNIPQYFSLYSSKSPKLPYEVGQLPPLKPNCCPLSDLVKREEKEKPGPSRSYGTRGMKKQKLRKRTAALLALEGHPRKSPREHASTLAILGSAGLLQRRKLHDDSKSTASEDTLSDAQRPEPGPSAAREASERLRQFLAEVFRDAEDMEVSDEPDAQPALTSAPPDISSLVSECDACDLIRNELQEAAAQPRARRGRFKKKNRTGWPNKKKQKKESRTNSLESEHKTDSLDRSSAEPPDERARDSEDTATEPDGDKTLVDSHKSDEESREPPPPEADAEDVDSSDNKLLIDLKVVLDDDKQEEKRGLRARRPRRPLLCSWLQPVVRVSRVDSLAARRLRSAARTNR